MSTMVRRVVEYSIRTRTPVIEEEHIATMTPYFYTSYAVGLQIGRLSTVMAGIRLRQRGIFLKKTAVLFHKNFAHSKFL